ncbi:MAG: hypothetical protein RLN70_10380 [Rhodospirillaceae bacterium]
MTKLMKQALESLRDLSEDRQDEIARMILRLAAPAEEPEPIPDEDLPYVLEGLAQAERGTFSAPADVETVLRRFSG